MRNNLFSKEIEKGNVASKEIEKIKICRAGLSTFQYAEVRLSLLQTMKKIITHMTQNMQQYCCTVIAAVIYTHTS